jgi:molecular chaperone GrpE
VNRRDREKLEREEVEPRDAGGEERARAPEGPDTTEGSTAASEAEAGADESQRRELGEASERAQGELMARLLDGLDDLERVLATPAEATTVEALHEGVELVERKLRKELSDAGLERIEAEGEPFDPRMHDALLTVPVGDPDRDEVVSRVLVNGYRLGDRVLRPARVEVMKYQPGAGDAARDGAGDGAA